MLVGENQSFWKESTQMGIVRESKIIWCIFCNGFKLATWIFHNDKQKVIFVWGVCNTIDKRLLLKNILLIERSVRGFIQVRNTTLYNYRISREIIYFYVTKMGTITWILHKLIELKEIEQNRI